MYLATFIVPCYVSQFHATLILQALRIQKAFKTVAYSSLDLVVSPESLPNNWLVLLARVIQGLSTLLS